jgi:non-heme chloroperoxidase
MWPLTPGWPDDPETVEEAAEPPEVLAGKSIGQIADHFETIIGGLDRKPAILGHSTGGLLTQILARRGLAAVSVAIDPAPFRGVLPLPISTLRSSAPVLRNPANRNRAVPLTYDQFRYGFANAVSEEEAKQLYEEFAVPASGKALLQAALANLNPWTEDKVDTKNPDRGPLLLISGERDHTVPPAIVNASYKQQQDNPGVTEIEKIPGHGHALIIDSDWLRHRSRAGRAVPAPHGQQPTRLPGRWAPQGPLRPGQPPACRPRHLGRAVEGGRGHYCRGARADGHQRGGVPAAAVRPSGSMAGPRVAGWP